jgi:acyl transferase domain-containing protein
MARDLRTALLSPAQWTELLRDPVKPDVLSGDSLGEIAALVAAGAVTAGVCLRLTTPRGRLFTTEAPHA